MIAERFVVRLPCCLVVGEVVSRHPETVAQRDRHHGRAQRPSHLVVVAQRREPKGLKQRGTARIGLRCGELEPRGPSGALFGRDLGAAFGLPRDEFRSHTNAASVRDHRAVEEHPTLVCTGQTQHRPPRDHPTVAPAESRVAGRVEVREADLILEILTSEYFAGSIHGFDRVQRVDPRVQVSGVGSPPFHVHRPSLPRGRKLRRDQPTIKT